MSAPARGNGKFFLKKTGKRACIPAAMQDGQKPPAEPAPNLILTGFMGTGKTSVGHVLAHALKRPFFDTDREIERRENRKIKEIFAAQGEAAFRALEQKCVDEWLPDAGAVISTGGGILTSPGMCEKLRSRGIVVTLFATPETIFARTRGSSRPLLKSETPEERTEKIRTLLAARERDYRRAGIGVFTDGVSAAELAERILRIYRREIRARRAGRSRKK